MAAVKRPLAPCPVNCNRPCCIVASGCKPFSDDEDSDDDGTAAGRAVEAHDHGPAAEAHPAHAPAAVAASASTSADATPINVWREVLVGERILSGQCVRLVGLRTPGFNGKVGHTGKWDALSGRFEVELDVSPKVTKKFKPDNLEPFAPCPIPWRDKDKEPIDYSKMFHQRDDGNETIFPLAVTWNEETDDLHGFVAMEKYDGVRGMWEGPQGGFRTRGGATNKELCCPPPSLKRLLPTGVRLDGELWVRRGAFEDAALFKRGKPSSKVEEHEAAWRNICYKVYDCPSATGSLLERLAAARAALPPDSERVHVVQTTRCEDAATARALRTRIESLGGEGLVLRRDAWGFRPGRVERNLLKVKTYHDREATVVDFVNGKNACFLSAKENGTLFKVAANGHEHKLALGSVVTYKFAGLCQGQPRFPSIGRVHCRACDCDACCLARGGDWPVSPHHRVADNKTKIVRR